MWACQNQIASGIMQVILHHYIVWPSTPILAFRRKGGKNPLFDRLLNLKKKPKKTTKTDPSETGRKMLGRACILRLKGVQIMQFFKKINTQLKTKELSQC